MKLEDLWNRAHDVLELIQCLRVVVSTPFDDGHDDDECDLIGQAIDYAISVMRNANHAKAQFLHDVIERHCCESFGIDTMHRKEFIPYAIVRAHFLVIVWVNSLLHFFAIFINLLWQNSFFIN